MASEQRFPGQVVLVTGASRGIGRAIARAFAADGAALGLVSTQRGATERVAAEIAACGGKSLALAGDVSVEADVRRFVAETESRLGPIDVLVNNAGIPGPTAPATEIPTDEWARVLAVNLTGAFLCAREVLRGMVSRAQSAEEAAPAGRIINVGSMAGKIAYPKRAPYASSKWGLIGLTLTLAEEVGPYGIRVNCICPGPVETELLDEVIQARARATGRPVEAVRQLYTAVTMMKRIVKPEEVAALVLFLASDAAAAITGQAIDVSAGWASVPAEPPPPRPRSGE